jgi:hypothetical protein
MFPDYISTILWQFAVKCYKDRMNHLVHQADGRTLLELLASLDSAPIKMLNFHTFGCPCYVLDHRLQSGTGKNLKWEHQAWMGIYLGCSPSHAFNVGLIMNPRMGHVLPQFHIVCDDDFMTVPYLRTAAVSPHCAELVKISSHLEVYTERQEWTWQSLPEIDIWIQETLPPTLLKRRLPQLTKIVRETSILRLFPMWNHPMIQHEGTIE